MQEKKSAGAVIFHRKDGILMYLLLKYPRYWGFVKGTIESGEEELETLRREAQEEANLSRLAVLPGFREEIHYKFNTEKKELIRKTVIFFCAEISEKDAAAVKISSEHFDFKWLPFSDALKMVKHANERNLLKKADMFVKQK